MITSNEAIKLTPAAVQQAKNLLAKQPGVGLRLRLTQSTGCSQYTYVVEIAEAELASDKRFDIGEEFPVFVERDSFSKLNGVIVDYAREGLNRGFKFVNPNEKASCGCGKSFAV